MSNSANVVPVIDTSSSMKSNKYVDITKRDSNAFISYALPNDGIGVVSYDTNGRISYPSSGSNLVIVDQNLSANVAATNAINAFSFKGSSTNIGGGILSGRQLLDSAASPKAMVLLTDGFQNAGTDPLSVLPNYPIYTCAMGSKADQDLLRKIATQTGGNFYVAPYPSTMMLIFNQIRALPADVQSIQNEQNSIPSQGFKLIPATFSANNLLGQFGVVWDDNVASWTSSSNPGANQVSVTLVQPDGSLLMNPVITEKGYAIFNEPSPGTGQWYVQIIAGALSQPLQVTSGVFEITASPNSIVLNVSIPMEAKTGQSINVEANVTDGGEPITNLRMTARIEKPSTTQDELVRKYGRQLEEVQLQDSDVPDHLSELDQRIAALRSSMMPQLDIMEPLQIPGIFKTAPGVENNHSLNIAETSRPGIYNVQVMVTGYSNVSGTPFQRSEIHTVEVK